MNGCVQTIWVLASLFGTDWDDCKNTIDGFLDHFRPALVVRERHMNPEEARLDRFWRNTTRACATSTTI